MEIEIAGRILGSRFIRGWRWRELEEGYDQASQSGESTWLQRVARSGHVRPSWERSAKAEYARKQYRAREDLRGRSRDRVYAWRRRQREELQRLRDKETFHDRSLYEVGSEGG